MRALFSIILFLSNLITLAQTKPQQLPYTYDLGIGKGYHFLLTQNPQKNFSNNGYMLSFGQRFGRNGIVRFNGEYLNTSDLLDRSYSLGFHVGYSTAKSRRIVVSGTYSSLSQLFIDAIISLIPKNMEYSLGVSAGYLSPLMNLDETEKYKIVERYYYAMEAGIRMNLYAWRFKLAGGATLAYNLSNNFVYIDANTMENANFFLKPNFSLSFSF